MHRMFVIVTNRTVVTHSNSVNYEGYISDISVSSQELMSSLTVKIQDVFMR